MNSGRLRLYAVATGHRVALWRHILALNIADIILVWSSRRLIGAGFRIFTQGAYQCHRPLFHRGPGPLNKYQSGKFIAFTLCSFGRWTLIWIFFSIFRFYARYVWGWYSGLFGAHETNPSWYSNRTTALGRTVRNRRGNGRRCQVGIPLPKTM